MSDYATEAWEHARAYKKAYDDNLRISEYETKDSGERQVFDSGMQRDTTDDKMLWHLVADGPMLKRWAELMTRGARKYDQKNWMKAEGQAELDRFRESAFRHFMQWYLGVDDGEDHAAAVFFNISGAEYVLDKLEIHGPPYGVNHE